MFLFFLSYHHHRDILDSPYIARVTNEKCLMKHWHITSRHWRILRMGWWSLMEATELQWRVFKLLNAALLNPVNNLRYATILVAEGNGNFQKFVNKIIEEFNKIGLQLNSSKKTETVLISKRINIPKCSILSDGKTLMQLNKFSYLGTSNIWYKGNFLII